jgi:hypothetical protein
MIPTTFAETVDFTSLKSTFLSFGVKLVGADVFIQFFMKFASKNSIACPDKYQKIKSYWLLK